MVGVGKKTRKRRNNEIGGPPLRRMVVVCRGLYVLDSNVLGLSTPMSPHKTSHRVQDRQEQSAGNQFVLMYPFFCFS